MNENHFTPGGRMAMAVLAVLFGLFIVFCAPFLIQRMLDETLNFIVEHQAAEPGFVVASVLLPIFVFLFRAISAVAGIALIVIAYSLWKGEEWAWSAALSCISLPTMFSVLFVLPYLAELGKPPITVLVLLAGLAVYITFVLIRKGSGLDKLARFVVLALLGMLPGHASILVIHSLRSLLTRPDKPLFTDPKITIFGFEGPVNFIIMILCIIAIPLAASQKKSGWYLGLIAGIAAVVADYPTHFIRLETSDFFVGGTLGLLLVISLLIPAFKTRLFPGA